MHHLARHAYGAYRLKRRLYTRELSASADTRQIGLGRLLICAIADCGSQVTILDHRDMRRIPLIALLISCFASGAAGANDWRYCLATASSDTIIYLSKAFESEAPLESLQRQFAEALIQRHYQASGIQCPKDESSVAISADIAHLMAYQKALGHRVSPIEWP